MSKVVALVDADIVAYRLGAMLEDESEWRIVKFEVDQYLMNAIFKPIFATHYIGFFTGKKNFRKELTRVKEDEVEAICKPYKGGRSDARPYWFVEIVNYLNSVWKFVIVHGMEADDAIAMSQKGNSYICSNDHDYNQVPGWHWDFTKRERKPVYITEAEANYNFWLQMLTGCNTDEVEGIPGFGPKKAADALAEHSPEFYESTVKSIYIWKFKEELGLKKYEMTYKLLRLRRRTDAEFESYGFTVPALQEVPISGRKELRNGEEEDEF